MTDYTLTSPVELVTGGHNGFPGAARLASGRIVITWRAGSNHSGGTPGVIKKIYSTDSGATWSTPVTVLAETGIDLRDPALTILADGRIAMTLFRYNGSPLGVNVSYSSDDGETWTAPALVPFTNTAWSACSGPIAEPVAGTLLALSYGLNVGDSYESIRCVTSTDNGATWGDEVLLLDGQADSVRYQEPFAGVLADGRVMVDVREGAGLLWRRRLIRSLAGAWSEPTLLVRQVRGRPAWMQTSTGHIIVADRINGTGDSVIAVQDDETAALSAWQTLEPSSAAGAYQQMVELGGGIVGVAFCEEHADTDARLYWTRFSPPTTPRRGASALVCTM